MSININSRKFAITSPSRLHLGFYGLNDNYGYSFGSMGLAINAYKTRLSISPSKQFKTNISKSYINPIIKYFKPANLSNIEINTLSLPPQHIGLGSGTQLSLCTGKAISIIMKKKLNIDQIANIYKRGLRSGIGLELFKTGGFIVDSGKKTNELPKPILKHKFPSDWKIILLNDKSLKGSSGSRERYFFRNKNNLSSKNQNLLSEVLFRGIVPSLLHQDFTNFASNITRFQRITSSIYRGEQKGVFLSPQITKIMNYIKNFDNIGIGQSSWGPISYIFVESKLHAKELVNVIENKFKVYNNITLEIVSPSNNGYKIEHT